MASYQEVSSQKLDWAMSFQRTGQFPLDRTNMFSSYEDAVKYAAGDTTDPDSRALCGSSYVGQVITVYENDVVSVYKIEADRTLSEVGTATSGDDKSIVLDNGVLKLKGFDTATDLQQLRIRNIGSIEAPNYELEWFTPDGSTVAELAQKVQDLETIIGLPIGSTGLTKDVADLKTGKADKETTYTKDEIDSKLTGALHYKGTATSFEALLADIAAGTIKPENGDVYNIQTAGGTDFHNVPIKAGDNVIYNDKEQGWDVSAGTTDLSDYYTKEQVDAELDKKVDKVDGSRLITTQEAEKLAADTKVAKSDTNGNILIDDQETQVYRLPDATTDVVGGVKLGTGNNAVTLDADGSAHVAAVAGDTVNGAVAEASKVTHTLTVGAKTFDGSANVDITAADIPLPDTVIVETDIATETSVGVVLSSNAKDQVYVENDGRMTVNDISASKISGVVSEAAKTSNVLKAGQKEFNGSAEVEITAADLGAATVESLSDYVTKTGYGTETVGGSVKSSAAQDQVAIGTDGLMTVNDISASKVKGTVSSATNAEQLAGVAGTDILVTNPDGTATAKAKAAATSDKLTNARAISLAGDATGTGNFDGTGDLEIAVTLETVVDAGTYTKVTTDTKGRVTSGTTLEASDIPSLTMSKITDAGTLATKSEVARTDLDTSLGSLVSNLESASHTHANQTVLNDIDSIKVAGWDKASANIDNKADKAATLEGYGITDAYTKTEVDGIVAGAYHFKGSYPTLAALVAAVVDPKAGDVYNIETAVGETDRNGNTIKAGDNVAYVDTEPAGWDILGGTMDLSAYALKAEVTTALNTKADASVVTEIGRRLDTAESTIGNADSGLVRDVAAQGTRLTAAEKAIATNTDNITKNATAISDVSAIATKLDGTETSEGSVKNLIAASATQINEKIDEITADDGIIDTKISTHNTNEDAHADLFAAKQNKVINASVAFTTADFAVDASGFANYSASVQVTGLVAANNYAPNIAPATVADCTAVLAAKFYPMAMVDAGKLTVYCQELPTANITVVGTFTQIQ